MAQHSCAISVGHSAYIINAIIPFFCGLQIGAMNTTICVIVGAAAKGDAKMRSFKYWYGQLCPPPKNL